MPAAPRSFGSTLATESRWEHYAERHEDAYSPTIKRVDPQR